MHHDVPRASALTLFLLTGLASAQDEPLEGHSWHGEAFNEGPRQAAYRIDGTGNVHFPVSDLGGRLQDFFDQGIGQLHGFWYFEAERTFRQIAAEAPDCAMAYWGMAMANADNPDRAGSFAREAWLLRDGADDRERMYIDALAKFYDVTQPEEEADAASAEDEDPEASDETVDDSDEGAESTDDEEPLLTIAEREQREKDWNAERETYKKRAAQLVKDYEEIIWAYPDDIEAKAFLVNRMWMNRRFGHSITSRHANEAMLQQVLAANPMHPAHHYRIHLWDAKDSAEHVVESAVKSGHSAPGIAHMWHMGGHIFARLGRHSDAAWQQEASARVDHAHMMRDWVLPDQIHNFAHNNEWLTRSLRHHGRVQESVSLARNMIELPRHPAYNMLDMRGCSASHGRSRLLETLELYEQWDELAALADTMYLEPSEEAVDGALRAFALGKAYAHLGDEQRFQEQVASLEAMLERSKTERSLTLDEREERALAQDFERADLRAVLDDVLDEYARELADVRDKLESLEALWTALSGADPEPSLKALADTRFDKSHLARLYLQAHLDQAVEGEPEGASAEAAGSEAAEATDEENANEEEAAVEQPLLDRAVQLARDAAKNREGQLYPHATLAHVLHEAGETEEALEVFDALRPWTARADLELPVFQRLAPLAELRQLPADWRMELETPADVGDRIDLAELGPLRWTPPEAHAWTCSDAFGNEVSLEDYAGRPVVVIFFLGFGCVHCVEQLVAFAPAYDEYRAAGIDIVTIGNDTVADLRDSFGDDPNDTGYPFPVLSDAEMEHFRRYRAYDDFEDLPLHGTFLIDGTGRVRWQDVSFEPFMDWEFLLEESQRLLGLDAPALAAAPERTPGASASSADAFSGDPTPAPAESAGESSSAGR